MNTLLPAAITPPEQVPLDQGQHDLVFYALVVAGLALFASFVHSWNSKGEVSARYRPAVLASTCITGVAARRRGPRDADQPVRLPGLRHHCLGGPSDRGR